MDAKEYSVAAHSTACHGGTLAYPVTALTEEITEAFRAYWEGCDTEEQKHHVADELMDVIWNVNELAVLTGTDFSEIETAASDYAKQIAAADESASIDNKKKLLNCLGHMLDMNGYVSGAFAKYVRKHNGSLPDVSIMAECSSNHYNVSDVASKPKVYADLVMFKGRLFDPLTKITGAVIHALDQIGYTLSEGYVINTTKLSKRKANNTLGGEGSVERKGEV